MIHGGLFLFNLVKSKCSKAGPPSLDACTLPQMEIHFLSDQLLLLNFFLIGVRKLQNLNVPIFATYRFFIEWNFLGGILLISHNKMSKTRQQQTMRRWVSMPGEILEPAPASPPFPQEIMSLSCYQMYLSTDKHLTVLCPFYIILLSYQLLLTAHNLQCSGALTMISASCQKKSPLI